MKMAKASEADLRMAMDFTSALESLMRYGHMPCDGEHDEPADFDIDDKSACQQALQTLFDIAERGSLMRVVWGMAVLLDPLNEVVDPDCDVLQRHPKYDAAPDLLEALRGCIQWYGNRSDANFSNGDSLLDISRQPPEIQRSMQAIAKAEGRAA